MDEILDELERGDQSELHYPLASQGTRFGNYIIDLIGYMILSTILGVFMELFTTDQGDNLFGEPETFNQLWWFDLLLGVVMLTTYYTASEYLLKGKTLGKLLTKTRAVTIDNKAMDFNTVFIRSLCRSVPFDAFSFLGDGAGWHDRWSKTKVIEDQNWIEEELL